MASAQVAIAEAIKDAINAELSLGATRAYRQDIEREEISSLAVYVVPAEHRIEPATRANNVHEYDIDIGIFLPVDDSSSTTDVDPGLDQAEAILELWDQDGALRDQTMAGAYWERIAHSPTWDPDHLNHTLYASRIRLTYRKNN